MFCAFGVDFIDFYFGFNMASIHSGMLTCIWSSHPVRPDVSLGMGFVGFGEIGLLFTEEIM